MRLSHSPGRIPLLSELGLLVLLAWMVSGWLLPEEKTASLGLLHESAVPAAALPDLTGLLAVPLFGEVPAQAQAPKSVAKVASPVVQSPLTLKLLGTVVAGDESAAIISLSSGSDQRVFLLGETIQPGVTLHAVEPWAIVVDRAGVLERISLEQGQKLAATPMPVPMPTGTGIQPAALPAMQQHQMNRSRTQQQSMVGSQEQRRMSRDQVQQQLGDLPALLSQARVVPNYSNGKADGFVISEISQGSLYQQAGLQNGDVILRVNGQQVTSAQQAMSMYQGLQNAAAIDLELMRAGQMKQVHFDIR